MTVATVDRPTTNLAEMGLIEAKGITQAIKENFDSLGSMLLQARDRKAYKALGYRSFDTYCKTEFGKSISHAYQLIEDVKVVAELEAELSKQYDEPVTLNFPSSHLRSLKEIPGVGDKLKAIEYAQKLAKAEGRTPTRKHLEIAVFEISGKRSEDFRSAIQSLGFTKGTQVEITRSLKQDRGFVVRVDKKGKIYVELYDGGAVPIPYDATDLRILGDTEKPAIPANDESANKGDKVKIFAKGREGQTGEIFTWQMGKHAMVKITDEQVPVNIAYAELELIQEKNIEAITVETIENIPTQWREDLSWANGGNHYYYFAQENKIYNTSWPNNITITPNIHSKENPTEYMEDWMQRFAGNVAKSLVSDVSDTEILIENQRLREQLAEAEVAIQTMVNAAKALRESTTTKLSPNNTNISEPTLPDKIEGQIGLLVRRFEDEYRNAEPYQIIEIEGERINCLKPSGFTEWIRESNLRVVVDQPMVWELLAKNTAELAIEAIVGIAHQQIEILPEIEQIAPREFTTKALGISFAKTIDELLDGKKTQTRRLWQNAYASSFIRYFEEGIAIPALNKSRHRGGHELGHIKLTERPYQQILSEMSAQDLLEEGGMAASAQEFIDRFFEGQDKLVWVLHFEFEKSVIRENPAEFLVENTSDNSGPGDTAAPTEFLVEDAASKTSPLDTETSWLSVLESNDLVQNRIQLDEEPTETYRGWDIYVYDDSPVADISHPNKGTFSTDFSWHREEKEIIKPFEWLKNIINQVEDFCPGQLSLNLNPEIKTEIELFPQEMIDRVDLERKKLFQKIENLPPSKGKTKREKEQNAKKDLEALRHSLSQLEKFEQLKIGQNVWYKGDPEITGEITGFAFTTGGMPHVFVRWNEEEIENSFISTEIVAGLLVSPPGL